jgi:hypothetical protein
LRCARDSFPPLRSHILLDLARHPDSPVADVSKRIVKPYRTVRRELEALHTLGLLRCDGEQTTNNDGKTVWRYPWPTASTAIRCLPCWNHHRSSGGGRLSNPCFLS